MLLDYENPFYLTTATLAQRYTTVSGATVNTGTIPRTNTAVIATADTALYVYRTLGSDGLPAPSGARAIIGGRYRTGTLGGNRAIFNIADAGTVQVSVTVNSDGTVSVRRGPWNGTVLGTTTYALSTNTWYYIELDVTISDTVGTIDLYIDGVNKLSLTAQDTKNTANASWTGYYLLGGGGGSVSNSYITDIYVEDGVDGTGASPAQLAAFNTPLGDVKVEYLGAQAGNGTYTDWTCSTGSDRGALVDDGASGPNGDTDYVSSATSAQRVSFALANLANTAVNIKAVMPIRSLSKDDAGSKQVKPGFYIGGTPYDGTAIEAPAQGTYRELAELFTKSAATGVAWTPTEVNAMEGIETVV